MRKPILKTPPCLRAFACSVLTGRRLRSTDYGVGKRPSRSSQVATLPQGHPSAPRAEGGAGTLRAGPTWGASRIGSKGDGECNPRGRGGCEFPPRATPRARRILRISPGLSVVEARRRAGRDPRHETSVMTRPRGTSVVEMSAITLPYGAVGTGNSVFDRINRSSAECNMPRTVATQCEFCQSCESCQTTVKLCDCCASA